MRRAASLAGLIGFLSFALFLEQESYAQSPGQFSTTVKAFVRVDAPVVALEHVRVIDGTGAAPLEDQIVVLAAGKIQSLKLSIS